MPYDSYGSGSYEEQSTPATAHQRSTPPNMAVQGSLFDIFETFTVIISGELKNRAMQAQCASDSNGKVARDLNIQA
jgi:hypothetical protein